MKNSPHIPTVLLTGASGLLGRFVLARLLASGREVAVLVRPARHCSAAQRVEEALAPCETTSWLSRPRTLSGDLTDDGLALSSQDRKWLSQRPLIVVHCAASIRFQCDAASGEPYRTNVDGTRNLLEVCQQFDVKAFHYVSTAYVGCRVDPGTGSVEEKLISDPSLGGNDYEMSKIQAEQLVARCPFLGAKTIHRPSIIVGDSQSSFTSTYHGFYAPLQIGYQLAKHFGFSQEAGQWFRQQLGLQPHDSKNLVPVDWVAEAIASVVERDLLRTYPLPNYANSDTSPPQVLHWTNPQPVPCLTIQEAIATAVQEANNASEPQASAAEALPAAEDFRAQMQVYESYFRSDPNFDSRQSQRLAPELPCPSVDRKMLRGLAKFAIDQNFGWPKPQICELPHQGLVAALRSHPSEDGVCEARLRVRLLGPGAPETLYFKWNEQGWSLAVTDQDSNSDATIGRSGFKSPTWTFIAPVSLLADCVTGKISLSVAIEQGYCIMEGLPSPERLALVERWIQDVSSRVPK